MSAPPVPTADAFLLAFHQRNPGATSRAFAHGHIEGIGSSYQWLLAALPRHARSILDLGCGDGHLLTLGRHQLPHARFCGIDFSPEELALAAARPDAVAAELHLAHAAALPFAAASFDHVVSHLAFMLMTPVEGVLAEVARVLVPGGTFATVVGGGPKLGDSFEAFVEELIALRRAEAHTMPTLGDRRCRTDAGLAQLFEGAGGLTLQAVDDATVILDGTASEVWAVLSTVYELHEVGEDFLRELRDRWEARLRGMDLPTSVVPCRMATRRLVARRTA